MTKDLCDNFESLADGTARRGETEHPWKKTRMPPPGQILLGSRHSRDQVPVATIPVHRYGNSPDELTTGHYREPQDYLNLKVGDGGEGPNPWGVKRKVDAVTGTCSDRHLREKLNDSYLRRVLANEIEVVPFNFMHSQRAGQWASLSPAAAYPTPPKLTDLYGLQAACTARGSFVKRTVSCNAQGKDPKPSFKVHHSRSSTNMLKLPKDMQGRWSTER